MAQIMGGLIDLLQAGFSMSTRASTSSPTLQRQLRALRSIRAVLHCGSRATNLGASMHTMQALVPNPTVPSWRSPPSGQHGGAGFGQALLSGQRLHRPQSPVRATRALLRIHARHPFEKPGCALQRSSAGRGHPQRRARACQSLALASAGQYPVVANALQTRRQDVLHEPAHELFGYWGQSKIIIIRELVICTTAVLAVA